MPRSRPVTAVQGHAIRCDLDALDEDMYVPVDTTSFVGTLTYPCVHCHALKFHGELHNNSCCQLSDSWRPCRLCHYLLCSSSNSSSVLRSELYFFVSTFVSSTQPWLLQVWESVQSSWAGAYLLFVFTALHITSWAHWLGVPMTSRNSPYFFDNNEAVRARTRLDIFQGFASTPDCPCSQYFDNSRTGYSWA